MKVELFLIIFLSASAVYLFSEQSYQNQRDTQTMEAFMTWKTEFAQNYDTKEEQNYRFSIFKQNFLFINHHNKQNDQLVLALNEFAALSDEEFESLYLTPKKGKKVQNPGKPVSESNVVVDWAKKGAVTPVQNQGMCGSCWAFSAAGGLEGLRSISEGILEKLSVQQLVACIPKQFLDPGARNGCGGSEAFYAYNYTHQEGIQTWKEYPYVSGSGKVPECTHSKEDSVFFNTGAGNGYVQIARGDVKGIKDAIVQQPLSIAVAAGNRYFKYYSKGILNEKYCGTDLDHVILLTGMNDEGRNPYWTVKNSWGTGWGMKGFANIAITDGDGVCGINMESEYPTLN